MSDVDPCFRTVSVSQSPQLVQCVVLLFNLYRASARAHCYICYTVLLLVTGISCYRYIIAAELREGQRSVFTENDKHIAFTVQQGFKLSLTAASRNLLEARGLVALL